MLARTVSNVFRGWAGMYVCICNRITDQQVRAAALSGASRPAEVYPACGCAAQCGTCAITMRHLIYEQASRIAAAD
ncbi:MAG: (2Fe-2S)-binding protein [Alphaproteobacteria bacterium]|jgi:bacterioferritin-associated ferredoxin|nr:(2Fe-2S)-binding protein [Alphaproteobacteria bacterium]